jgi:carbonic anhydrase
VQIQHIIVCGHYDCGAVKAASSNTSLGSPLDNWLMAIRDVKRLHGKDRRWRAKRGPRWGVAGGLALAREKRVREVVGS